MIGTFSVTWRLTSTSFSKETPNLDINTCFDVHKKTVVLPWNYYHGSPLPQHTKSVTELCRDGERQRMWKLLSHVWLCEPVDCVVRGILQARILVWVASPFSRVSSQPRDWTWVCCTEGSYVGFSINMSDMSLKSLLQWGDLRLPLPWLAPVCPQRFSFAAHREAFLCVNTLPMCVRYLFLLPFVFPTRF